MKTLRKHIIAALALCAALLPSCGTNKATAAKAAARAAYNEEQNEYIPIIQNDFSALTHNYFPWNDFSASVRVEAVQPKKIGLSGKLEMVSGQALSLRFRMLFVEVGRMYADNDSVYLIAKPLGVYFAESMSKVTERTGLSLPDMQALILGQVAVPGKGVVPENDLEDFRFSVLPDRPAPAGMHTYGISPRMTGPFEWTYLATAPDNIDNVAIDLLGLIVQGGDAVLNCRFNDTKASPAGYVNGSIYFDASVGKRKAVATLETDLDKAKWNSGITLERPSIAASMKRITASQLLQILKKL